jgi:molybdopterin synthase sulfur carrier subunit
MRVRLYATLRDLLKSSTVEVDLAEDTTIRALLRRLVAEHPELGSKLWDDEERLTGLVKVLLNGRAIQHLAGLDSPVSPGDNIALFPPVGGG